MLSGRAMLGLMFFFFVVVVVVVVVAVVVLVLFCFSGLNAVMLIVQCIAKTCRVQMQRNHFFRNMLVKVLRRQRFG